MNRLQNNDSQAESARPVKVGNLQKPQECDNHTPAESICSAVESGPDLPIVEDIREAQRRDPTLRRLIERLLPMCKKGTSTEGVPLQPSGKNQEQFFMRDHVLF